MAECFDFFDDYHEATLNGIPFYATDMSDEFGRRGPTHEYPDRDIGSAEDLGRKQPRFNVSGWVGGDDHVAQIIRLRRAAERVSPATLVHPIWGSIQVKIDSFTTTHNIETEAKISNFSIQAVEFGGLNFPTAIRALGGLIEEITNTFGGTLRTAFEAAYDLTNFTAAATNQVDVGISAAAQAIYDQYLGNVEWNEDTPDFLENLQSMIDSPSSYRTQPDVTIFEAIQALQVNAADQGDVVDALEALMNYGAGPITATGVKAPQIVENLNLIVSAVRSTATIFAVQAVTESVIDEISGQVSGDLVTLPAPKSRFSTSSDALAFLDQVVVKLDQEIAIAAARCDDDLVRALRDALHNAIRELQDLAYELPPRLISDLCVPLPSLVAAHRATGDARRVLEIERRNPGRSKWFMRSQIEYRGA